MPTYSNVPADLDNPLPLIVATVQLPGDQAEHVLYTSVTLYCTDHHDVLLTLLHKDSVLSTIHYNFENIIMLTLLE